MNAKDDFGRSAGPHARVITFGGGDLNRKLDKLAWHAERKGIDVRLTARDRASDATPDNPYIHDILCEFPDATSMQRFKAEVYDAVCGRQAANLRTDPDPYAAAHTPEEP